MTFVVEFPKKVNLCGCDKISIENFRHFVKHNYVQFRFKL